MQSFSRIVAALAIVAAAPAFADTIGFGQFGSDNAVVVNGSSGLTAGGVAFTLNSSAGDLKAYVQNVSWSGNFAPGTLVLLSGKGTLTLAFAASLSSLEGIALQSNNYGEYMATANYYNGATLLTSLSFNSVATFVPGTVSAFSYYAGSALITSVVFSTTNDDQGFGIGGTPETATVPEPASWALMIVGFAMVGAAARRRSSVAA